MKKFSYLHAGLIVVGIVVGFVAGYLILHRSASGLVGLRDESPVLQSDSGASSTPQSASGHTASEPATSSRPTIVVGAETATYNAKAAFDSSSFVSAGPYATVTGTANIPSINVTIYNSAGTGLAGSSEVPVVKGHWSYSIPIRLEPGVYTVRLGGAGKLLDAKLTVKNY